MEIDEWVQGERQRGCLEKGRRGDETNVESVGIRKFDETRGNRVG